MQVKVTQRIQGFKDPQYIRRLKRGDFFGEKALLRLSSQFTLEIKNQKAFSQ